MEHALGLAGYPTVLRVKTRRGSSKKENPRGMESERNKD